MSQPTGHASMSGAPARDHEHFPKQQPNHRFKPAAGRSMSARDNANNGNTLEENGYQETPRLTRLEAMSLRPIYGHRSLLDRLGGVLASSRFPQAALLTGPRGVGKQRLALWVAQGLLCERGPGAPCGTCSSCHQVGELGHPDCHWFVPIPRPKAADPDKQSEEAAAAIAGVLDERRKTGLWERPDGTAAHGLSSVRLLNRRVWVTPFSGSRKVFILGDAERLIVQEASPEAANALLKVLEEPPADTTIILTAADQHALLPTIRSRLVAIRVGRVTDDEVRAFAESELDTDTAAEVLERRILLAEGCAGRLLAADADDGESLSRSAEHLLTAVRKRQRAWLPLALRQQAWSARGDFTGMLDALSVRLRAEVMRSGNNAAEVNARLLALKRVDEARLAAQGNVNPQLTLAALASDLERIL